MRTTAGPSIVGISIFVPSAASVTVSGIEQWMLSPMRLKNGCSPTLTTTYRSPAGPPNRPLLPFPERRMREPVATPGGRSTSRVSERDARPSPRQLLQGLMDRPVPPQSPHVTANCKCPFVRIVFPIPEQPSHALSREPGCCPVPLHVPHASIRTMLIRALRPVIDSPKVMEIGYSTS